jgi:hypothetical protein
VLAALIVHVQRIQNQVSWVIATDPGYHHSGGLFRNSIPGHSIIINHLISSRVFQFRTFSSSVDAIFEFSELFSQMLVNTENETIKLGNYGERKF